MRRNTSTLVVASDYSMDLKIGLTMLKHLIDAYRRLRNTLRYLIGNLNGFDPFQAVPKTKCRA